MPKSAVMTSVSRPLIGLLVATVAFFAVWTLALKHSSGSGGGTSTGAYQSAIDKAHQAVATSDAASAAHGGTVATTPTASATGAATSTATTAAGSQAGAKPGTAAHSATKGVTPTRPAAATALRTAAARHAALNRALKAHKVVAVLFFNARATDDKMVHEELGKVPGHDGRVFKLAVPLVELANYPVITRQVQLNMSPTLVLVDPAQRASTILGFSDTFEINQRVAAALAVQPG